MRLFLHHGRSDTSVTVQQIRSYIDQQHHQQQQHKTQKMKMILWALSIASLVLPTKVPSCSLDLSWTFIPISVRTCRLGGWLFGLFRFGQTSYRWRKTNLWQKSVKRLVRNLAYNVQLQSLELPTRLDKSRTMQLYLNLNRAGRKHLIPQGEDNEDEEDDEVYNTEDEERTTLTPHGESTNATTTSTGPPHCTLWPKILQRADKIARRHAESVQKGDEASSDVLYHLLCSGFLFHLWANGEKSNVNEGHKINIVTTASRPGQNLVVTQTRKIPPRSHWARMLKTRVKHQEGKKNGQGLLMPLIAPKRMQPHSPGYNPARSTPQHKV